MATATGPGEESSSMALCPACSCLYKDPRFLPCCHSICLECIEVTNSGHSRCPRCHNVSEELPSDMCFDSTANRVATLERTRDELEKVGRVLCSECEDETEATHFCITCSHPLCELDLKVHKKMYKDAHSVVAINKLNCTDVYNWGLEYKCKFHQNVSADKFCTTCKYLLCPHCLSHHHPDHKLSVLQDAKARATEMSQVYQTALNLLNDEDDEYRGAQKFLEKVVTMITDVENEFNDLKKVLDDKKKEVMDRLGSIYKDTLAVIQKGECHREHFQDLITKTKSYEKLSMDGQLLTDLETINSKLNDLIASLHIKTKYSDIDFIMNHDIKSMMKGLGYFRLKHAREVMPVKIIETNSATSKYEFTPFMITRDDQDNMYNMTEKCDIIVMNREGDMLRQFRPYGMPSQTNCGFVHWNKRLLYIVSGTNSVTVCNESGKLVKTFGREGEKQGQLRSPLSIAVSNINGDIYVLEKDNNRVQVFNSEFLYNRFIGHYVDQPGQIKNPCELALTPEDEVVVAQRNIPCINIYDSVGAVLRQFGSTLIDGKVFMPGAMCISRTGQLLLSDLIEGQIVVYDKDKLAMWTVGSMGDGKGEFYGPGGLVCMDDGTVYVCDMGNKRIQVYSQNSMILGDI